MTTPNLPTERKMNRNYDHEYKFYPYETGMYDFRLQGRPPITPHRTSDLTEALKSEDTVLVHFAAATDPGDIFQLVRFRPSASDPQVANAVVQRNFWRLDKLSGGDLTFDPVFMRWSNELNVATDELLTILRVARG